MEFFKLGKFEQCLVRVNSLKESSDSVSTQLILENDALVCQYMLGKTTPSCFKEDFKQLLMKSASLPPNAGTNRLELALLHNFIYADIMTPGPEILSCARQGAWKDLSLTYTQAARIFFRVYFTLQPLECSEVRRDLPTDPQACCDLLVQRCLNCLPFNPDANLLVPVCHVINLLAVIQLRSSNWKPAIDLLISLIRCTEDKKNDIPVQSDNGFLLPLTLDDSADSATSCPLDWTNFLLGLAHFQEKQWKQSMNFLKRVNQECFQSWVSYIKGLCLLNTGEFSAAISAVGQQIKISRISPVRLKAKMLNLLGDCFGKMGKPQLAIEMYKEALSSDFGYLLPLYNISLQYQQLGARDVELECLNLLVTSLESDTDNDTQEHRDSRFISVLDHINTNDNNISYPTALYRLANRCLQLERYDISSQKYQDLLNFLTDCRRKSQEYQTSYLPSLRKIYHEAILALLKAGKYQDCLTLCDKVIVCHHKGQGHYSSQGHYLDTQVSIDNSQVSDVVMSEHLSEQHNENNRDVLNNNLNPSAVDNTNLRDSLFEIAGTQTLKRKRRDSDTDPVKSLDNEIKGQSRSQDSKHDNTDESREFDELSCDVIALKYKAEVLEKLGENNAAIDCLERAIESISDHRRTTLQKNLKTSSKHYDNPEQPSAKRQRLGNHGDQGSHDDQTAWSYGEDTALDYDPLTQFEAELYQSLGTILSCRAQYSDALHYYRLAAQLLPDYVRIHYLWTKTLLSMNCPKVASANWLKHRKLPQTSRAQIRAEIAKKQDVLRKENRDMTLESTDYNQLDLQCLTLQQTFLDDR